MITYFITCNRSASYIADLISHIYRPEDVIIVHCDKKSPRSVLETVAQLTSLYSNIYAMESRPYSWAGFSQVKTTIDAIDFALQISTDWTHFITLSEQHLPLLAPTGIEASLAERGTLMDACNFDNLDPYSQNDIRNRFLQKYRELPGVGCFAAGHCEYGSDFFSKVYHGSNWYIISICHCKYISARFAAGFFDTFSQAAHPDENAIQSLLWSDDARAVGPVESVPTTFVAWPHLTDNSSLIMTEANFWAAVKEDFIFIRKRPASIPISIQTFLDANNRVDVSSVLSAVEDGPFHATGDEIPFKNLTRQIFENLSGIRRYLRFQYFSSVTNDHNPLLYLKLTSSFFGNGLYVVLLSEDLVHFKVLLMQDNHEKDAIVPPFERGGYSISMVRARIHSVFFNFEVVIPDHDYGFVTLGASASVTDLCSVIRSRIVLSYKLGRDPAFGVSVRNAS